MINIHIRDMTTKGGLVYYTIESGDWEKDDYRLDTDGSLDSLWWHGDWEIDDHATTIEDALKMIAHNLKCDYREYERDLEDV